MRPSSREDVGTGSMEYVDRSNSQQPKHKKGVCLGHNKQHNTRRLNEQRLNKLDTLSASEYSNFDALPAISFSARKEGAFSVFYVRSASSLHVALINAHSTN